MFAHLHRAAGFGTVGAAIGSSLEAPTPMELSQDVTASAKSYFSSLSHAEIASIWDSVPASRVRTRTNALRAQTPAGS